MNTSDAPFQKALNGGLLGLAVLAVLAAADEDVYPYELIKRLRERGGELPFSAGALYPILRSMAAQGWLSSRIVPSYAGPARRYYRITATGRAALAERLAVWRRTHEFVDRVTDGMLGA